MRPYQSRAAVGVREFESFAWGRQMPGVEGAMLFCCGVDKNSHLFLSHSVANRGNKNRWQRCRGKASTRAKRAGEPGASSMAAAEAGNEPPAAAAAPAATPTATPAAAPASKPSEGLDPGSLRTRCKDDRTRGLWHQAAIDGRVDICEVRSHDKRAPSPLRRI